MFQLKKWIRFLLGFSRRETNGLLVLLPLTILILFFPHIYNLFSRNVHEDFLSEKIVLDSMVASWKTASAPNVNHSTTGIVAEKSLFSFNPNSASIEELHQLGFAGNVASRIYKYRERGGSFNKKSDLLKIYGIDSLLYQSLYNYIQLPESYQKLPGRYPETFKPQQVTEFDLNHADSTELIKIKGIGPILAQRIVKYRNRLGGFAYSRQLYEVFGLDSSAIIELLKVAHIDNSFPLKKINLNKADEKELSLHPYISKAIAKTIVAYRFQHGAFTSVEDIRNLRTLNEETTGKLFPYLSTTE